MKKTSRIMWAIVLASVCLFALCGCKQNVGGYTKDRKVTEEDLEIFNRGTEELIGVSYVPKKVATQVVAGTNYRFYCTATPVVPDAEPYDVHIFIYVPLGDNPVPQLTEITELE